MTPDQLTLISAANYSAFLGDHAAAWLWLRKAWVLSMPRYPQC